MMFFIFLHILFYLCFIVLLSYVYFLFIFLYYLLFDFIVDGLKTHIGPLGGPSLTHFQAHVQFKRRPNCQDQTQQKEAQIAQACSLPSIGKRPRVHGSFSRVATLIDSKASSSLFCMHALAHLCMKPAYPCKAWSSPAKAQLL